MYPAGPRVNLPHRPLSARRRPRYFGDMRTLILTGLTAGVLALNYGCELPNKAYQEWLTQGEQACTEKKYDVAIQLLTNYINAAGSAPEAARAYYFRGVAHAQLNHRSQARDDLLRAAQFPGKGEEGWRALSVLGTLEYESGHWAEAAKYYEAVVDIEPQEPPKDLFLYRLAASYERSGRWQTAQRTFQRILDQFPQTAYKADITRRLQLNADHFSVQCGVFSTAQNADGLMKQLQLAGFSPTLEKEPRSGATTYVVHVGRFTRYEDAIHELARVKGYIPGAVLWP